MVPETCWASNKICNKNSSVASSWHFISTNLNTCFFLYVYSTDLNQQKSHIRNTETCSLNCTWHGPCQTSDVIHSQLCSHKWLIHFPVQRIFFFSRKFCCLKYVSIPVYLNAYCVRALWAPWRYLYQKELSTLYLRHRPMISLFFEPCHYPPLPYYLW
jgi:hypothetical protein